MIHFLAPCQDVEVCQCDLGPTYLSQRPGNTESFFSDGEDRLANLDKCVAVTFPWYILGKGPPTIIQQIREYLLQAVLRVLKGYRPSLEVVRTLKLGAQVYTGTAWMRNYFSLRCSLHLALCWQHLDFWLLPWMQSIISGVAY